MLMQSPPSGLFLLGDVRKVVDLVRILKLIEQADVECASDVHCSVGDVVRFRIQGRLTTKIQRISHQDVVTFLREAGFENDRHNRKEVDFSFNHPVGIRTRIHVYYQKGLPGLSIRLFPKEIPSPQELKLPAILLDFLQQESGLVLVTGATGSGKSTTIASLIHYINQKKAMRIITLEDPIEYVHTSYASMIIQREVGLDTESFTQGVHAALRQDPDLMVIGELRDQETIHAAIRAAEAGRLVLGTLHTRRAMTSIQRMIDVFAEEQRALIRSQLATSLIGIVSQRLVWTVHEAKREACFEVLVNTPAVANLIRSNQMHQMESLMQTGAAYGMQTFDTNRELSNE